VGITPSSSTVPHSALTLLTTLDTSGFAVDQPRCLGLRCFKKEGRSLQKVWERAVQPFTHHNLTLDTRNYEQARKNLQRMEQASSVSSAL